MTADLAGKIRKLDSCRGEGVNLSDFQKHLLEKNKFYILKTEEDKLAAICETNGFMNTADVHFTESSKDYGLAGQTILASIVKQMLKTPEAALEVSDPVDDARKFYMTDCGFKEKEPGSHGFKMEEEDMERFVLKVEQNIQSPIKDIEE